MRRYAVFLSVRNMLIVLAVIAAGLFAVELYFGLGAASEADVEAMIAENKKILMMQVERIPEKDMNITVPIEMWLGAPAEASRDYGPVYPLLSELLPSDDAYGEDTFNIVVLGDSFVWGAYSTNRNELFWRILENDLRAEGYDCRVYGVGMAGACSADELAWLRDSSLVEELDPDLVIVGYVQNDPVSDTEKAFYYYNNTIDSHTTSLVPPVVRKVLPRLSERLSSYLIAESLYDDRIIPPETYVGYSAVAPVLKGRIMKQYRRNFLEPLNQFAGQSDFSIVLMTLPPYPDNVLSKALFAPLHEEMLHYPNVVFYDCLETFCRDFAGREHSANYFVNSGDDHPGSATNRFYANYIEDFLKRDYADLLNNCYRGKDLSLPVSVNEWLPWKLNLTLISDSDESMVYALDYPSHNREYTYYGVPFPSYFLRQPLGKDHIRLSFSAPAAFSSISVTGESCTDISLYYSRWNAALGYDDHTVLPCGRQTDRGVIWDNGDGDLVTSVYICCGAGAENGDRLTLTLRKRGAE